MPIGERAVTLVAGREPQTGLIFCYSFLGVPETLVVKSLRAEITKSFYAI
jgi:hypothetical protein